MKHPVTETIGLMLMLAALMGTCCMFIWFISLL